MPESTHPSEEEWLGYFGTLSNWGRWGEDDGSVGLREYVAELPALVQAIASGAPDVDARAVPLAQVEQAWADADAKHRVVLVP